MSISAQLGVRDSNEASWTQVVDVMEFMSDATSIPILLDADTGYGNFNNARRLVRKLEDRGVAGKNNKYIVHIIPLRKLRKKTLYRLNTCSFIVAFCLRLKMSEALKMRVFFIYLPSGACLEDKLFPKTNSLHDGRAQPLADIEEFALKIKVLLDLKVTFFFILSIRMN